MNFTCGTIMEFIPETNFLKFNPNTLYDVRKELNLHQDGVIEDILKNFEDWIRKQHHFKKHNFSRHYLETTLINSKGSLERAKKTLDKLCTLKTLLPDFFSKYDFINEFVDVNDYVLQATIPTIMKDNSRVYIIKMKSSDFDPSWALDFYRCTVLMSEYMKIHDYSLGYSCIVDCRDVNLINYMSKVSIVELRHSISTLMEGYGFRVKGIHIISSSKTVDTLISLLKQIVSDKIASRIKVHKTVDTLYEYIPKEVLPLEYGGHEGTLKEICEAWRNVLSKKENIEYFKDICQAGTNEKMRLTAKYNEQILGMPGSFRTLNVD